MKSSKIFLFILLFVVLYVFILRNNNSDTAKTKAINIYRFEQTLFTTDSIEIGNDILEWETEIGAFFENFNHEILSTSSKSQEYKNKILAFISHPDMREAYDTLMKKYPDVAFLERDLADAFDRYKQHFPERKVPKVITYFSGFNFGVVTNDSILAIGLDYFLGKDCCFYKRLSFPEYMRFKNQKKFILPYCFEAIANNEFGAFDRGNDFLSQMINKGKIMYFIDKMLPQLPKADKLRFSKKQFKWCEENEQSIWAYLIDNEILFSTDVKQFNSYINYSPFAKGMTNKSPGRIAYWLGWKIVYEYIENNKNLTLEQLMQNTDAQQILQQSGYKP